MGRSSAAMRQEQFPAYADIRCDCGSLLARLVDGLIELKCRRCRRVVGVAQVTRIDENHPVGCGRGGDG